MGSQWITTQMQRSETMEAKVLKVGTKTLLRYFIGNNIRDD